MATEVKRTVRASGGDYTSLVSAEAGEQRNLVTGDQIAVLELYNDWPSGLSGAVTIAGWTTDATRYVKLTVAPGHRHNGTPKTGFWMTAASALNGSALTLSQGYTQVEYFDIDQTGAANGTTAFNIGATTCQVVMCVAKTASTSTSGAGFYVPGAGASSTVRYCLAYGGNACAGYLASAACTILNSTATGCSRGFSGSSASAVAKNCVGYGNTTQWQGTWDTTNSTNNATSNATDDAPGGASVTGVTSAAFANAGSTDFHLAAGSVLIGAGVNAYSATWPNDIDGNAWPSSGAWDIGFDYYVAGGGPVYTAALTESASAADTAAAALTSEAAAAESVTAADAVLAALQAAAAVAEAAAAAESQAAQVQAVADVAETVAAAEASSTGPLYAAAIAEAAGASDAVSAAVQLVAAVLEAATAADAATAAAHLVALITEPVAAADTQTGGVPVTVTATLAELVAALDAIAGTFSPEAAAAVRARIPAATLAAAGAWPQRMAQAPDTPRHAGTANARRPLQK